MKNKVLSIEQMQELIDMGIDVSKASMCYLVIKDHLVGEESTYLVESDSFLTTYLNGNHNISIKEKKYAFTLQDILDMLPKTITDYEGGEPYEYILSIRGTYDDEWWFEYFYGDESIQTALNCELYTNENPLSCAFELLKWCKQNNYI